MIPRPPYGAVLSGLLKERMFAIIFCMRQYIAIDLKSFYASVECVDRNLNPLTTNLVVADVSRTEKTICLAVSPSLKAYGISGRARLFEVVEKVRQINAARGNRGSSYDDTLLQKDPSLKLDYIAAPPRMSRYMEVSNLIYSIYLKFVAPSDMHVYSVDEVFIDCTDYLKIYNCSAHELTRRMLREIISVTGITATAGIGTNLYLCKVAMDIVAKHITADADGVRIAELDERRYRELLWEHEPLTDFWRVGRGISNKLATYGLKTMGDIARCSLTNEDFLYKLFGINAELLIDHAWGYEPCTIDYIKSYKPSSNSLSSGQVLKEPYTEEKARIVIREMTELLILDLVEKQLLTDSMVLNIGYDIENLRDPQILKEYKGPVSYDAYGRSVPKHGHGSVNLGAYTSSTKIIIDKVMELWDRVADKKLLIRRLNIAANDLIPEKDDPAKKNEGFVQLDMFTDYEQLQKEKEEKEESLSKEKNLQKAMIEIRNRYGKNAVLKGSSLKEGSTVIERNGQIGGHKA